MTYDLLIALLDDQHGISANAWRIMRNNYNVLFQCVKYRDIVNAVKVTEGRAYLPEEWSGS